MAFISIINAYAPESALVFGVFLDLSDIDGNTGSRGDQDLEFVGIRKISGTAGEVRFSKKVLQGDTGGDGHAEFRIVLTDVGFIRAGDLLI